MIQKHKFVEKNIKMLRTLVKSGYVSPKLLSYYNIYNTYMSIKGSGKIDRYKQTALETRNSVTTVRRAVADMKKYVSG